MKTFFGFRIFSLSLLAATFGALFAHATDKSFDAQAHSIPVELRDVGISEKFGAQVDLNLTFRNESGQVVPLRSVVNGRQPVLLFLAYYGCPNLCNLFLNGATEGLKALPWTPGKEFQVVTVSIDPTENPRLATAKKESHMRLLARAGAEKGWHFWVNDKEISHSAEADASTEINARTLARLVGFGYKYDKDQDQYAHSAGMIVLTPEGKVSRYLYGIEFQPNDLRLALTEAGGNKIGTLADRLLLYCYHYDPKGRKYALYATNVMRAGGGVTVFVVGGVLTSFWRRNRRRKTKKDEPKNA